MAKLNKLYVKNRQGLGEKRRGNIIIKETFSLKLSFDVDSCFLVISTTAPLFYSFDPSVSRLLWHTSRADTVLQNGWLQLGLSHLINVQNINTIGYDCLHQNRSMNYSHAERNELQVTWEPQSQHSNEPHKSNKRKNIPTKFQWIVDTTWNEPVTRKEIGIKESIQETLLLLLMPLLSFASLCKITAKRVSSVQCVEVDGHIHH